MNDKKYTDIINHNWTHDSLPNRMPLNQRAKIFLPFAALTGFDEALDKTLQAEIAQMEVCYSQPDDTALYFHSEP